MKNTIIVFVLNTFLWCSINIQISYMTNGLSLYGESLGVGVAILIFLAVFSILVSIIGMYGYVKLRSLTRCIFSMLLSILISFSVVLGSYIYFYINFACSYNEALDMYVNKLGYSYNNALVIYTDSLRYICVFLGLQLFIYLVAKLVDVIINKRVAEKG